ncbi:MAG TPA: SufE family protein [Pirellulales bacterium]|jgi:cysteine desulfuration protein SufE|nr:SufE family protein [Pirellulales bacterium]
MAGRAQERLDEIATEFADLEPRERLELLLDFAEGLPDVPEPLRADRDVGDHRVHECMTPVYLWVVPENDQVCIHAEVAPEAPTVKGFVGILVDAFSGAAPGEILSVPPDILQRLGLIEALGMVRMRGLSAIFNRIRAAVAKMAAEK